MNRNKLNISGSEKDMSSFDAILESTSQPISGSVAVREYARTR